MRVFYYLTNGLSRYLILVRYSSSSHTNEVPLHTLLVILAWCLYIVAMLTAYVNRDSITADGYPLGPAGRVATVAISIPLIGVILWITGVLFKWAGYFLTLPLTSLF